MTLDSGSAEDDMYRRIVGSVVALLVFVGCEPLRSSAKVKAKAKARARARAKANRPLRPVKRAAAVLPSCRA
jgi:hypothetical protein